MIRIARDRDWQEAVVVHAGTAQDLTTREVVHNCHQDGLLQE
jgi:hypothetical protein